MTRVVAFPSRMASSTSLHPADSILRTTHTRPAVCRASAVRLLLLLRRCASSSGHFAARAACFGEPDRDRLLAARHALAGPAAAQFASLHFVHRALHLAGCFLAIPGHDRYSLCWL